jgi:hypothetical protein
MQPSSASEPLVLRMLADRLSSAYENDEEFSRVIDLAAAEGVDPVVVLLCPWLIPFADWPGAQELVRLGVEREYPTADSHQPGGRPLVAHLLAQDLRNVLKTRTEILASLAEILDSHAATRLTALRNALSYPFVDGSARMEVLLALSNALIEPARSNAACEHERAQVLTEAFNCADDPQRRGALLDDLGVLYKNSAFLPPEIARPYALACFEESRAYFDRESGPLDWAILHNNLGNLLRVGIGGDPVAESEAAIDAYREVLDVLEGSEHTNIIAAAHDNLALALATSPSGDPSENHYDALRHCTEALRLWRFSSAPIDRTKASLNCLMIVNRIVELAREGRDGMFEHQRQPLAEIVDDVVSAFEGFCRHALRLHAVDAEIYGQAAERIAGLLPAITAALGDRSDDVAARWHELAQELGESWRGVS